VGLDKDKYVVTVGVGILTATRVQNYQLLSSRQIR